MPVIENETQRKILHYFTFEHLPEELKAISAPLCDMAFEMAVLLKDSRDPAEVTAGLRKLLEAKDCFVRAGLRNL